ncbi:MAG: response regulator, partial [Blastocatellia bacterium]|nr:response regulator [Blastocatellia bacterium]
FSDEGADVSTVNNGEEAITKLRYLRPDLVMADVSIPGKDGYDICEFVKTHPELKGTPVILLVPAFEPYDEERARRAGADYHLTKPFQSIRTLISTVKNLIESSGRMPGDLQENQSARRRNDINSRDLLGPSDSHNEEQATSVEGGWLGAASSDVLVMSNGEESRASALVSKKSAARGVLDEDMDHVLELDDVLSDIWNEPGGHVVGTGSVTAADVAGLTPLKTAASEGLPLTLGESSIDAIVDRVVAQVLEKLPDLLSAQLADRLAAQVSVIIKGAQEEKAAYREADTLLELDEV